MNHDHPDFIRNCQTVRTEGAHGEISGRDARGHQTCIVRVVGPGDRIYAIGGLRLDDPTASIRSVRRIIEGASCE